MPQGGAKARPSFAWRCFTASYIAATVVFLVLAILVTAVAWYVRTPSFKQHLLNATSHAMGMSVEMDGELHLQLLPTPRIRLYGVHLYNRGTELAHLDELGLRFKLLPLLHRDLDITLLVLRHPRFLIMKGKDGVLNIIRSVPPVAAKSHGPMEVRATDAELTFQSGEPNLALVAAGCDAKAHDLFIEKPDGRRSLERMSFTGEFSCRELHAGRFSAAGIKTDIVAGKGVFMLEPLALQLLGAEAMGRLRVDFSGGRERYAAALTVSQFDTARIFQEFKTRDFVDGRAGFAADVSFAGRSREELARSMDGRISLHGAELTLNGYDVDGILHRFESSQRFNLLDLGAVFAVGPAGIAATKGMQFASIKGKPGGSSRIHVLVADLKVDRGIASAQDVALSTDTHRLAAQGAIDLVDETFDDVMIALVDAQGCVIAQQTLSGGVTHPKVKPDVMRILTGPVRHLINKGENTLTRSGCAVFYSGAVKPY